ncbi:hypothetical protein [Mycobacterium decipiens]|uniref:PE domain-containing protein n=1 Tax=Mycobacterium decipiens TaxID=1430326 RepID=A0A1X2LQD7_9MYCO|nr:hypothetical protein [Mycobacterium decipiens]OSC38478.1 hypothetical protein B8W66_20415 [Mycobacterium decipiens]
MQPGQLQIDVDQLAATAGQWGVGSADLYGLEPPSPGQPFQPTTAAVSGAHVAVDLAAAALIARAQATTASVADGAARYVSNEATAAEMAAVRSGLV